MRFFGIDGAIGRMFGKVPGWVTFAANCRLSGEAISTRVLEGHLHEGFSARCGFS